MREILFRGKDIYGKWLYGDLINLTNEIKQICNHTQLEHAHSVDIKTIGQYTGLTDKNGKKIFEGDIIKTHYANAVRADFIETVVFNGGRFCAFSEIEGCKSWALIYNGTPHLAIDKTVYMDSVEVIGNIHDNPELLGGGVG